MKYTIWDDVMYGFAKQEKNLTVLLNTTVEKVETENGRITYTFSIQNYGNTATTDDDLVQIRDTFTPILSDISVTYNETVLPTSNYSYDQATGVFSTNAGVINIPAATYVQSQTTGAYTLTPGTATVTVTGNISG